MVFYIISTNLWDEGLHGHVSWSMTSLRHVAKMLSKDELRVLLGFSLYLIHEKLWIDGLVSGDLSFLTLAEYKELFLMTDKGLCPQQLFVILWCILVSSKVGYQRPSPPPYSDSPHESFLVLTTAPFQWLPVSHSPPSRLSRSTSATTEDMTSHICVPASHTAYQAPERTPNTCLGGQLRNPFNQLI